MGGVLPESPGCGTDARCAERDGRRLLYTLAQWRHEEVRRTGNQVFRSRESAISRSAAGNGVMASTSIACCCGSDPELKFPSGSHLCAGHVRARRMEVAAILKQRHIEAWIMHKL